MDIRDKMEGERISDIMAYAAQRTQQKVRGSKQKKDERPAIRSWKMTKAEAEAYAEYTKIQAEIEKKYLEPLKKALLKYQTKQTKFMTMVEERLDEYDLRLRVNKKTKEIEQYGVMGDDSDDDDENSPFN